MVDIGGYCLLWFRHLEVTTYFAGKKIIDIAMARYGRTGLRRTVNVDGMVAAFAQELAAVRLQMP